MIVNLGKFQSIVIEKSKGKINPQFDNQQQFY